MVARYTNQYAADPFRRGAIYIFKRFFNKKKQNTQPENARIARRAVKLARLAEINNVSFFDDNAGNLADRIAVITDRELDTLSAGVSGVVGCPTNIIPLFAGYSQNCAACPYYLCSHNGNKQNCCALKES